MSNNKHSSNFSRGLAIMNFILEGDGHSVVEAAAEFKISRSTVEADLNFLGSEVFYGNIKNSEELQKKYISMRKKLSIIDKKNRSNAKLQKAASN